MAQNTQTIEYTDDLGSLGILGNAKPLDSSNPYVRWYKGRRTMRSITMRNWSNAFYMKLESRKNKINAMKRVALIACITFITIEIFGQTTSVAIKFDEINDLPNFYSLKDEPAIGERIKRFVSRLRIDRGKQVYLITYRARILEENRRYRLSNLVSSIKWAIPHSSIKSEDIFVVDGGLRQSDTIELWIAPKNAEAPRPTPTFDRSEAIDCPSIYAYQEGIEFNRKNPIDFKASTYPAVVGAYNWTITDGKIIGANGSTLLKVDVSDARTDRVTAFLEVKGIPLPCKNTAYATTEFGNSPRLLDEFGDIANGDFKARLDAFFVHLQNHPEKQGYAYIYGDRDAVGSGDALARKRLLTNQIFFRRFDASRIKIVDAGFREELSSEFLLVPPGTAAPMPTPTVDKRFIRPGISTRPARK